jgi:hypothetical protein
MANNTKDSGTKVNNTEKAFTSIKKETKELVSGKMAKGLSG